MSRAAYTFVDKSSQHIADVIEFELLDNSGVKAWQYAVMLNDKNRIAFERSIAMLNYNLPHNIEEIYQNLKATIRKLDNSDYVWKDTVPDSFEKSDQDFFNRLHRHFTSCCYDLWDHRSKNFEDYDLNQILQDINATVHNLELYVSTDTKVKFHRVSKEICMIGTSNSLGFDLFPFREFHSYEHADLILDSYILGKTLIESFFCEDNPTCWDTNGHMKTNGGATILLTQSRSNIYDSSEFKSWLKNYNLTKNQKFADFPLGNFVPGHKVKLEQLAKNLHNYSVQVHIQN